MECLSKWVSLLLEMCTSVLSTGCITPDVCAPRAHALHSIVRLVVC